jgi:hypothetical protein
VDVISPIDRFQQCVAAECAALDLVMLGQIARLKDGFAAHRAASSEG